MSSSVHVPELSYAVSTSMYDHDPAAALPELVMLVIGISSSIRPVAVSHCGACVERLESQVQPPLEFALNIEYVVLSLQRANR